MNTYTVYWIDREVATINADRFVADGRRMYFYIGDFVVASVERVFATKVMFFEGKKKQE